LVGRKWQISQNWHESCHTLSPNSNSPGELSFATIHRTCWFRSRILVTVFWGHISQHQFFTRYWGWTGVQILSFSTWVAWGFHWKALHRCIWWLVSITFWTTLMGISFFTHYILQSWTTFKTQASQKRLIKLFLMNLVLPWSLAYKNHHMIGWKIKHFFLAHSERLARLSSKEGLFL